MSLDLVAVQRDEALLDALSQRRRPVGIGPTAEIRSSGCWLRWWRTSTTDLPRR